MPYCIVSSYPGGRLSRITRRTADMASRRSGGRAARYSSTVAGAVAIRQSSARLLLRGRLPAIGEEVGHPDQEAPIAIFVLQLSQPAIALVRGDGAQIASDVHPSQDVAH